MHDDEEQAELRRQLDRVRRRVDEAVARLASARGRLAVEGPGSAPAVAPTTRRGDLFLLCVRLEVALAESTETADKLAAQLRA